MQEEKAGIGNVVLSRKEHEDEDVDEQASLVDCETGQRRWRRWETSDQIQVRLIGDASVDCSLFVSLPPNQQRTHDWMKRKQVCRAKDAVLLAIKGVMGFGKEEEF